MQTFSTLFAFDNLSRADFLYLQCSQGKYRFNLVGSGLFIQPHFHRLRMDMTGNHGVILANLPWEGGVIDFSS